MKKLLLPLLSILLLIACQKEISTKKTQEEIGNVAGKGPAPKIDVCHFDGQTDTWHTINISSNAWPDHQLHGDVRLDDQDGDGFVPNNECDFGEMGDCDDLNANIKPGAIEICYNNIDDNCNGQIDEGCFVTICDQQWMPKNLDVSTYRNGDPIPEVTDLTAWAGLTTGAWCYYNNDPANGPVYGKLYNWYAVTDPRGLAPPGCHVPTNAEWTTLTNCLGGIVVAGGPMKETGITHWLSPNTAATNSSGFTGLPGGNRSTIVSFTNIRLFGLWWSSTEVDANVAFGRRLDYINSFFSNILGTKRVGISVRCIRD